jgi:ABC-type branched-subunit amino acid transport system substrate-binding protein
MAKDVGSTKRLFARPEGLMIAALSAAAVILLSAAAIGGRASEEANQVAGPTETETEPGETLEPGATATDGPQATSGPNVKVPTGGPKAPGPIIPSNPKAERRSTEGATREGIHGDHFEIGIHAPITFDGAPLNLAEDPITGLKGFITYLNRNGGVNGLKARLFLEDDRYTTSGARQVGDKLAKEIKPFMMEGTLGIDQIHKVLLAAKGAGIPYFAGGGPEAEFKQFGMYQIISNYDQYLVHLVDYICKYGKAYVGGEVRLGTTRLNSEYIGPTEKRFVSALEKRKCVKTPVDSKARGTVIKPTEQTSYTGQALNLRGAYNNLGANLLIPLQDPITTSRQVLEWSAAGYRPKWTFSNFAHDSDTALTLMKGEWTGVRGLSGGCYYHPDGGGKPYDEKLCAKIGEAKRQWVSLGNVTYDENAGGAAGGKSNYNYTDGSWTTDGSGGAAGYQLVYFWHGALKSIGADPTRERFLAALNNYDNYSNLVTGPITFKGSSNRMIGASKFVMLEGKSNLKYRQVTDVTPGLVDHF